MLLDSPGVDGILDPAVAAKFAGERLIRRSAFPPAKGDRAILMTFFIRSLGGSFAIGFLAALAWFVWWLFFPPRGSGHSMGMELVFPMLFLFGQVVFVLGSAPAWMPIAYSIWSASDSEATKRKIERATCVSLTAVGWLLTWTFFQMWAVSI